jgi:TRAP-type uncharacterized transport system fused permease subunit
VKLLVPFLFVTMPGLLMIGTGTQIFLSIVFAGIGVVGITVGFAGWLVRPLVFAERMAMIVASLLVLWPTDVASTEPVTIVARLVGIVALAFLAYRSTAAGEPRPASTG